MAGSKSKDNARNVNGKATRNKQTFNIQTFSNSTKCLPIFFHPLKNEKNGISVGKGIGSRWLESASRFIPTIRLSDDVHSKTEKKHDIEPNESRQKRKNILREPMNIYFSPLFHIAKVLRGVCGDGGLLEQ